MGELNKKKKHNHTLTDLLKVSIFSAVMLAPFLAIGVRCGYVMWNKNAKDSYSDNSIAKLTKVINITQQIEGQSYLLNFDDNKQINTGASDSVYFSATTIDFTQFTGVNYNVIGYRIYYNGTYIYLYDDGNVQHNINTNSAQIKQIMNGQTIVYKSGNISTSADIYKIDYYLQTYQLNKLDNAFSYSVSQISNDPIFNWTRNTGIYQPINAMVQGLEIENDTLQILLAYWSLMTAVYIVFDLIIFCFTKLTHFINE